MLNNLYSEKINVTYGRTLNEYGSYSGGSTKIINGAVQEKQKNILKPDGQVIISSSVLFTEESLDKNDIITYNSQDWQILEIKPIRDHFGIGSIDHYEVYF